MQRFEFDVRGYFVLKGYYTPEEVAEFNAGIDELQQISVTQENYTKLGLSLDGGIPRDAALDPTHDRWHGRPLTELAAERKQNRIDMLICGTEKFDRIVRDPSMKAIHTELAGGQCMLSKCEHKQSPPQHDSQMPLSGCLWLQQLLHREAWPVPGRRPAPRRLP